MGRFHNDVIKKKYGDGPHLLFTDPDSLMDGVCSDGRHLHPHDQHEGKYDLSNYPMTLPKYNADFLLNKAKQGLKNDEAACSIIHEFVGLRPKMYSFVIAQSCSNGTFDVGNRQRAKVIQRAVAEKFIHQQYKAQLYHPE